MEITNRGCASPCSHSSHIAGYVSVYRRNALVLQVHSCPTHPIPLPS